MTRRTLLGALKCAFRELRRELDTILAIAAVDGREMGLVEREGEVRCRKIEGSILSGPRGLVSERASTGVSSANWAGRRDQRLRVSQLLHLLVIVTTATRCVFPLLRI